MDFSIKPLAGVSVSFVNAKNNLIELTSETLAPAGSFNIKYEAYHPVKKKYCCTR